jgi:uncharacterized damage-inducible protein DinB
MIIVPPVKEKFGYYDKYIAEAKCVDLIKGFHDEHTETQQFILSLPEDVLNYRYEKDKWTIKEIMGHLMDCEIVFMYRALRFARKDKTPLPSFDENLYAQTSNAGKRDIMDLMREYDVVRNTTIHLFKTFDDKMLDEPGIANELTMTPRALGYSILGHEVHHRGVIRERYIK